MTHLNAQGRAACGAASPDTLLPYLKFDEVACPECRVNLYGRAAKRLADVEAHQTALRLKTVSDRSVRPRILGPLGDVSQVDPKAPREVRARMLHATLTPDEKVEAFRRITDMAADSCPSCGGSIRENTHSLQCLGPNPLEWALTDQDVQAELELMGYDLVKSRARFGELLDTLQAKALGNLSPNSEEP